MYKRYIEFTVWNIEKEAPATAEEIAAHVRIVVSGNGKCEIDADDGYSVGTAE